jgi:hypothetical protein
VEKMSEIKYTILAKLKTEMPNTRETKAAVEILQTESEIKQFYSEIMDYFGSYELKDLKQIINKDIAVALTGKPKEIVQKWREYTDLDKDEVPYFDLKILDR